MRPICVVYSFSLVRLYRTLTVRIPATLFSGNEGKSISIKNKIGISQLKSSRYNVKH